MRPDQQQNCRGLPGEGRGHKVGTSVPTGLPNPVVVPTASGNPDPCVHEGDRQHNCGCPVQGAGDTMAPVTKDGGQDLSAVRDPPGRPLCLQGDSSVTPVHDSPPGGQSSPGSGRCQSDVGLRPGVHLPPPTLVPTVANKLRGSKARMLLTAPCWCDTPWMPVLTELLFDTPRRIPMSPRLLINTATNYPVGNVEALRLTVWPICGQPQASTSRLLPSRFWRTAGDPVPGANTRRYGRSGQSSVKTSLWTQLPYV